MHSTHESTIYYILHTTRKHATTSVVTSKDNTTHLIDGRIHRAQRSHKPCIARDLIASKLCVERKHWIIGRLLHRRRCESRRLARFGVRGVSTQLENRQLRSGDARLFVFLSTSIVNASRCAVSRARDSRSCSISFACDSAQRRSLRSASRAFRPTASSFPHRRAVSPRTTPYLNQTIARTRTPHARRIPSRPRRLDRSRRLRRSTKIETDPQTGRTFVVVPLDVFRHPAGHLGRVLLLTKRVFRLRSSASTSETHAGRRSRSSRPRVPRRASRTMASNVSSSTPSSFARITVARLVATHIHRRVAVDRFHALLRSPHPPSSSHPRARVHRCRFVRSTSFVRSFVRDRSSVGRRENAKRTCVRTANEGAVSEPYLRVVSVRRRLASTVGVDEDARARLERRVRLRAWSHSIRVAVFASNAIGAAQGREPRAMDER